MMKKYGIITHYDVHNHGAMLQLDSLVQVLRKNNVDAKALQFEKNYDFLGRDMKAKYEISIKSIGIYLRYIFERGLKCTFYNYNKKRILKQFRDKRELIGNYYTECEKLDGVVVGSDEVFALHTGPTPVFFGHALPTNKVFAYGGCFGPTSLDDIERLHCKPFVESGLKSMCGLGMRDENSMSICKQLVGKTPELVCDPVILHGYTVELDHMKRPYNKKYMVVYAYDQRMNSDKEINAILYFAKKHNLKVISPGFFHKWVDKNINVSPIELINWFKFADYVVTDTFHGCVLSLITNREMAVLLRDNTNKLLNLMKEYGISHRVIDDSMELEKCYEKTIDWDEVNSQIKERRESSLNYLKRMIAL